MTIDYHLLPINQFNKKKTSWVINPTVTTKGGNDCIPILISNSNYPTTDQKTMRQ
jgi:hypothetical protein